MRKRTAATIHAPGGVGTRAVAVRGSVFCVPMAGSARAATRRATTKRFAPRDWSRGSAQPGWVQAGQLALGHAESEGHDHRDGRLRIRAATATATTSMTSSGMPYGSRRT